MPPNYMLNRRLGAPIQPFAGRPKELYPDPPGYESMYEQRPDVRQPIVDPPVPATTPTTDAPRQLSAGETAMSVNDAMVMWGVAIAGLLMLELFVLNGK